MFISGACGDVLWTRMPGGLVFRTQWWQQCAEFMLALMLVVTSAPIFRPTGELLERHCVSGRLRGWVPGQPAWQG